MVFIDAKPPHEDHLYEYLNVETQLAELGYRTQVTQLNMAEHGDLVDSPRWYLFAAKGSGLIDWPVPLGSFPGLDEILIPPEEISPRMNHSKTASKMQKFELRGDRPFSAQVVRTFPDAMGKLDQDGHRVYSRRHPLPLPAAYPDNTGFPNELGSQRGALPGQPRASRHPPQLPPAPQSHAPPAPAQLRVQDSLCAPA